MVKKVVYPTKRLANRGPYDRKGNGKSIFGRVRSLFFGGSSGEEAQAEHDLGNTAKYPAPDATFISNLTSRRVTPTPQTPNTTAGGLSVDSPKAKLITYLNTKGISELEAEGILSMAKQIDEEEEPDQEKLPFSNQYQPFLKVADETSSEQELAPEKPSVKRKATSIEVGNDSVYSRPGKRAQNHSRIPSPFRVQFKKQNFQEEVSYNTTQWVTALDDNIDHQNLSSGAHAILSVLGSSENQAEKKHQPKAKQESKYKIFVNPYAKSTLSRLPPKKEIKEDEVADKTISDNSILAAPSSTPVTTPAATPTASPAPKESIQPEKINGTLNSYKPSVSSSLRTEYKQEEKAPSKDVVETIAESEDELVVSESGSNSPLVKNGFSRVFEFPQMIKQQYSLSDINESLVEQYKRMFRFQ